MDWQDKNGQMYRKFEFSDFKSAFEFMKKVADEAESQDHHPRWLNEYKVVEVWLSTHDAGKITDKDRTLAAAIDRIYEDSEV